MRLRETDGFAVTEYTPVTFISVHGDDNLVVDSARVSFAKKSGQYSDEENQRLIHYLWKNEHWTPFAHPHITFHFAAPMFLARQFVKHQVGFTWNEVSRRYVSSDPMFWVPDTWRKRPESMKQGSVTDGEIPVDEHILDKYRHKMREHVIDYRHMVSQGIAPEQVRAVMPMSMMTEWYWTGSLAAWLRFVKQRSHTHAQMECHPYSAEVLSTIKFIFPMTYNAYMNI